MAMYRLILEVSHIFTSLISWILILILLVVVAEGGMEGRGWALFILSPAPWSSIWCVADVQ